ncbi:envelope stress response membrane protein PspB [Rhizosaccharibacter radicis]|uniref:Phage shock protein B n=1 Tax=Rhizosaccharibacter radicis TaxID=2782605 RepID=A0ABT1VSK0_9PROT|nr:phage shock protein B [Acetobacteraceae bacterium KSS12]
MDITGIVALLSPYVVPLGGILLVAWIVKLKHDRHIRGLSAQGLSEAEQRTMAEMGEIARRMEQRVENLERILDNELSGWRSRVPL